MQTCRETEDSCENINPRQEDYQFPTKLNQFGILVLNSNQSQTRSACSKLEILEILVLNSTQSQTRGTCRDREMDPTA